MPHIGFRTSGSVFIAETGLQCVCARVCMLGNVIKVMIVLKNRFGNYVNKTATPPTLLLFLIVGYD